MEYRNNIRIIILERFVAEVPDEISEFSFFNNLKDNNIKEEENDNIKNNDVEEEEESRV